MIKSSDSGLWKPNGLPFCWQPKSAFEIIEAQLEREEAASAKLVYVALTWIASNNRGGRTFSVPINYISRFASLGHATVTRRCADLERIGLVRINRSTGLRIPNTYTLVVPTTARVVSSVGNVGSSVANVDSRNDQFGDPLLKERKKAKNSVSPSAITEAAFKNMREATV